MFTATDQNPQKS